MFIQNVSANFTRPYVVTKPRFTGVDENRAKVLNKAQQLRPGTRLDREAGEPGSDTGVALFLRDEKDHRNYGHKYWIQTVELNNTFLMNVYLDQQLNPISAEMKRTKGDDYTPVSVTEAGPAKDLFEYALELLASDEATFER